jgi:hypothetical protein
VKDGLKGILWVALSIRAPKVGHEDDGRCALINVAQVRAGSTWL